MISPLEPSSPNIKLHAIIAAVINAPKPMRYRIVSSLTSF
jgi:hypothetical protein